MKVYTKTGDQGTTSLVGGQRVSKNHPRLEAYGTVDELMAQTACLRDSLPATAAFEAYREELLAILDHLMRIASKLASEDEATKFLPAFDDVQVAFLERRIDAMQATLPPIDQFTLPGGHPAVSLSHVCRTVCRRCERIVLSLAKTHEVDSVVLRYLNRLSDYFYVLGRTLTVRFGVKELLWRYDK